MEERAQQMGERVAAIEARISTVEEEVRWTRTRLHDLESDRATLALVVKQVSELAGSIERIAETAASKAVEKWAEKKDSLRARRWMLNATLVLAGAGVASLIITLVLGRH